MTGEFTITRRGATGSGVRPLFPVALSFPSRPAAKSEAQILHLPQGGTASGRPCVGSNVPGVCRPTQTESPQNVAASSASQRNIPSPPRPATTKLCPVGDEVSSQNSVLYGTKFRARFGRAAALLALLGGFLAVCTSTRGERYLSLEEAQKICFPQADHFTEKTIRLTADEAKAIEQKSGVKVRVRESRTWLARQGTNLAGVLVLDHVFGKHDLIDYVVAVAPDGKVQQVEILEYREHYGGEIRNSKWRGQFQGKNAASHLRLNDDIYNISGATISCRNVTDGIRRVVATFELVVRPRLAAGGGVRDGSTTGP